MKFKSMPIITNLKFDYLKTSMTNFNTLLSNALTHIIIDGKVS